MLPPVSGVRPETAFRLAATFTQPPAGRLNHDTAPEGQQEPRYRGFSPLS